MILDKKSDRLGVFYRLGLIERSALTLENYAASEIGSRFYTEDFLKGICEKRNEVHELSTKAFVSLVSLSTFLAFFDYVQGTTNFLGLSISIPPAAASALAVLVSLNLVGALGAFFNQVIIDRYINTLGNRLGMYDFELALLNYTAQNLWVTTTTPKFFGLASGKGHSAVQPLIGFFMLVWGLGFLFFPIVMIASTATEVISTGPTWLELSLCSFAIFNVVFSFALLIVFSLKYKFRPAGTSEPTDPIVPEDFLDLGAPRPKHR